MPSRIQRALMFLLFTSALAVPQVFAAQTTWNGSASSAWSDPANWDNGAPDNTKDVVLTGAGSQPSGQDMSGLAIVSLTFDASATAPISIGGFGLTLTTLAVNAGSADHIIAIDVTLGANSTWTIGSGCTLAMEGAIDGNANFTKDGAGKLILSASCTYSGSTTVANGTLQLKAAAGAPPPGALIWLDANDPASMILNGSSLAQWNDKSGNGNDFYNSSSGIDPQLVPGGPSSINNLPVVHFESPDGNFTYASLQNDNYYGEEVTVFYVGRVTGTQKRLLSSVFRNWLLGYWEANQDQGYFEGWVTYPYGQFAGAVPVDSGTYLWGCTNDSQNFTGSIMYKNGVIFANQDQFGGYYAPHGLRLGGGYNGAPWSEYSTGDIAELLVYPTVMTDPERIAVETYLMAKWGIAGSSVSEVLPPGTAVNLTSATAVLDVNNVSQPIGSLAGVAGSSVTLGSAKLTVGGDNSTRVFNGVISGTGSLTKEGSGNLTFGASNTYSGTTQITGGNLLATAVNVLPNSTLDLAAGSNFLMSGNSQALGSLTGFGNVNLGATAGTVLTIGGNNATSQYKGVISGTGDLAKAGTGTFSVSYVQTYSGATLVSGGTLRLFGSIPAPSPAPNTRLWLDANDSANIILNGSTVEQWNDKAGGAENVSQFDPAYQPQVMANVVGSNSVMRFANMKMVGNDVDYGPTCQIFAVGKFNPGQHQRLVTSRYNNWLFGWWGGNMDQFHFDGWVSNGGTGPAADNNLHMYEAEIRGPGQNTTCYAFDDRYSGVTQLHSNQNGVTSPNGLQLGAWLDFMTEWSDGDVGEVIIYDHILTPAEKAMTENYLIGKWWGSGSGVSVNMLPTTTTVTLTNGGTLDMGIVTQTVASISGATGTRLKMDGGLFTNGNNATTSMLGGISGSGFLTKQGTGTLTLGGISSYAGDTTIEAGTLKIAGASGPPAPTTGPALWLDATDNAHITLAGSKVAAWTDKNGGVDGVTQVDPARQPALTSGAINGNPALRFVPGNMIGNDTFYPTPCHIFAVGSMNAGAHQRLITSRYNNWLFGWWGGNMDQFHFDGWVSNGGTGPAADNTPKMYEAAILGSGNTTCYAYDSRYPTVTQLFSNQNGTTAPDGLQLGAWLTSINESSNGDVGEIIIYDRILNATEKADTENYLIGKWFSGGLSQNSSIIIKAPGTLDVNGTNQNVGALSGEVGAQVLLNGGSLICGHNNVSSQYHGTIAGPGAFGKAGSGTFTIDNTLAGVNAISVLGGTMNLPFANATSPTVAVTISNGGTLDSTNFAQTFGSLAGSGGGKLKMGNVPTLALGGNNASTNFFGTISGNCNLIKNGTGTFGLGGTQQYTGTTTVNTGTLRLLGSDVPAFYSFESVNGTTVLNEGGEGAARDGVLTGGATVGAGGKTGNGLNIPSQAAWMAVSLDSSGKGVDLAGTPYTGMTWFNTLYNPGTWRTLFRGADSGGGGDHQLIIEAGSWRLGFYDNWTGGAFRPAANPPGSGNFVDMSAYATGWHHIAAVGHDSVTDFYIDGAYVGTSDRKSPSNIYAIGNIQGGNQAFSQKLDDVAVYRSALTATEINAIFSSSVPPVVDVLNPTVAMNLLGASILDVNGFSQTLSNFNGDPGTQILLGGGKLTLGGGNTDFTYGGNISGTFGKIVKNGTGTMTLTGTNSYTGGTTVNGGVLKGNSNGVQGDLTINNNTTVTFDQDIPSGTFSGKISGTGGIIKQNTGTLNLAGSASYSGPTNILAGILRLQAPAVPTPPPGARVWLDATDASKLVVSGSNITQWNDSSGNNTNFTPFNGGGNQPQYITSGAGRINGNSVVHFDSPTGSGTFSSLQNNTYFPPPCTVAYVGRVTGAGASRQRLLSSCVPGFPGGNWLLGFWAGSKDQAYHEGWITQAGGIPADANTYLYTSTIPGPGQNSTIYRNGAVIASNQNGTAGPRGLRLGGGYAYNQPTEYSTGDIGELFVYTSVLTTAQRQELENYMAYKWAIGAFVPLTALPPTTAVTIAAAGTLDLNNVTVTIGSLAGNAGATVALGSATLTTGNTTSTVYAGTIGGTGSIVKAGTGRFTLGGASTYAGNTTINAGALEVTNASGSATGTGAVSTAAAGTLTGNGIISGAVNAAAGTVAPGSTLGKLTTGNLTLGGASILAVELIAPDGGAANSGGDDELLVQGNLTLGGTLNVTSPGALAAGTYHLASFTGTVTGTFSTMTAPGGAVITLDIQTGSVNLLINHPPTLTTIAAQTVTEGQTIALTASGSDIDPGQVLTYSIQPPVPAGATIDPVSGAFSWTTTDGPGQTQNVTIRVTDNGPGNLFAQQAVLMTVNNVLPTATLSNGGAVNEGSTGTVSFSGQIDPSITDTTAGFHYSYDFDNNGSFEVGGGGGYAGAVTNASETVPATFLADGPSTRTVHARIWDKDNGFNDYTTTITINTVAPTANFINSGDVTEGTPSATVTFDSPTDPSPPDVSAGLHYAYDFDNNGLYEIGGASYLLAVTAASAVIPAAFLDDGPLDLVVRGRIYDKDGAFTEYFTTIHVDNVDPTGALDLIGDTTEGGTSQVVVSSQFDPSAADTNSGFHYSYDFNYAGGVPAFDLGGIDYAAAIPNSTVVIPPSQTLDGPATQTVLARIWDNDGGFTDYVGNFNIANVAPALSNLNVTVIPENNTALFTGTITDPGVLDTFIVVVDWLDGTTDTYNLLASATGAQAFSFSHQYLDDDPAGTNFDNYPVFITVTDDDGDFDSATVLARVDNVNPVVVVPNGLAPHLLEHATTGLITLATFTDAGTLDTHTVTIDWGDGTPLDLGATLIEPAGATPGQILANHLFDDGPGIRTVTVTVTDDDTGIGSATFNVIVDNVAPTATFRRPDTNSFTPMTSVEFVDPFDPSDADTAAGFLYSYDWDNDGVFEIAFDPSASMPIPPQYFLSHPNHIVHGRITDKDGGHTDYYLQQPFFASNPIFVEFDVGEQESYTLVATAAPAATYSIEVVDLPEGIANLAAIGLSFDGVATISGVPFVGGMLTLRATASNFAGSETVDLIITIKRAVNSNTPRITSAAQANPNPCITGTPVTFSVVATDADGDVLSYYWDFKDGSSARGRVVTHTFTTPGTYVIVVSISDGKHDNVFDQFNLVVAKGTDNTFDVLTAKLSFDFRKAERSTLYATGYIPIPSGPLAGVTANVSIPGTTYAQAFVFDSKGAAGDTMSLFSVKTIQTGTGTSRAKFIFSLKSTNGLDPLNPSLFQKIGSLFPNTTGRAGEIVPVPLVVTIGSQATVTNTIPLVYKVIVNRSGKGAFKRK